MSASPQPQAAEYSVDLRDLLEAGCHFGHQIRRWNPKMQKYIYTARDGVHIFDLAITAKHLEKAMKFVRDWVASGKEIVLVGTKRQAQAIVKEEAINLGAPFITERWLGGVITNWEEITQRVNRLKMLQDGLSGGKFAHYTKKERVLLDKEMARLNRFFGGLAGLKNGPEALFIVDTHHEDTAVKEAFGKGIPVVGMVDSNADPDPIAYPIPVNDDAIRSIKLVMTCIAQAYADGRALRKTQDQAVGNK